MTTALLTGALVGAGLWWARSGVAAAPVDVAAFLARLGQRRGDVTSAPAGRVWLRVGAAARRLSVVERLVERGAVDLRVLRRSPEEQAALLVAGAVTGLVAVLAAAGCAAAAALRLPLVAVAWAALAGAGAGTAAVMLTTRTSATERRRAFAHALASFCDVAGLSLAGGRGVDEALRTAAGAGAGLAFVELTAAIEGGYLRHEPPWTALGRCGADLGVDDLVELAAAISLTGTEGAAVRETVGSKARSIRDRLVVDTERQAASVSERMSLPGIMLLAALLVFLLYPALAQLQGHT